MQEQKFIISFLITLPLSIIWTKHLIATGKNKVASERLVEKAKAEVRVTTGKLVKARWIFGDDRDQPAFRSGYWSVRYDYTIPGRQKTYHFNGSCFNKKPPETIDLYWDERKPQKAIPEGARRLDAGDVAKSLMPLIIWAIIYWLLCAH